MANNSAKIRGVTIQLGGDTSGLSKALKDVNKEISDTQKELKDVERLLKMDPGNTELLRQKYELLNKSIDSTEDKLDALKEAEKKVQAQFEKGEASEQQYNAIKREVIETEAKLGSLKKEAQKTDNAIKGIDEKPVEEVAQAANDAEKALEGAGKEAEGFAESTGKITVDKIAGVSGKIAGVIGAAEIVKNGVEGISEMDAAMETFVTKIGLAREGTEYWKQSLEDIYKHGYGEDFNDIAESMAEVRERIGAIDPDALTSLTEDAIALRDVFGYDVAESVRTARTLIDNFGISGKEAFELIAEGAQTDLDYSGEMLDTINEYSVHFAKMGLDAKGMFEILSAGAENGAWNLDKVGDAIKELSIRVIDGSDTTTAGFEAIGLNADEMAAKFAAGGESAKEALDQTIMALENVKDPIKQNQAGVNLFGTMWEDMGAKAILSLNDATEAAYGTENALKEIKEIKYDNLESQLQTLGRTVQTDVVAPLLESLMPTIEKVVGKMTEFVEWFANLDSGMQNTILIILLLVAAIGPLLNALSGAKGMIEGLGSAMAIFATSPVMWVIAAIVGLVAIIATAGDDIQRVLQQIDDFLQNIFLVDWTQIFGPGLGDLMNGFYANFKNIWDSVKQIFSGIIDFIRGVFTGDWERVLNGLLDILLGVGNGILAILKMPINGFTAMVNGIIDGLNWLIDQVNKIGFDVPDWLGGGHIGVNIGYISKMPYLAKGGVLSQGSAIVGEAGPEILTMMGGRAVVQPLTSSTTNTTNMGGIYVSVYGAPGQSVNDLATAVAQKIEHMTQRRAAVFR